jgi:hypothetical protein
MAGFIYYRFVHDGRWFVSEDRAEVELPRWLKRVKKAPPAAELIPASLPRPLTREDMRAEVDRILDKINSEGLSSLTADERRVLDAAKDMMTRR